IRAKGLQIVPVSQLMHKTRSEVMPPIPASELWAAWMSLIGFWMFSAGQKFIVIIFFIGDLLMTSRLIFIGAFALYDRTHTTHFLNSRVGAVAGNAKVGNRVNLWTRWQALEYITSQNFERRALNTLGAVSVVPGAIGGWRVAAVREVGGFHMDTVAEDADLTMALLRNGYRVEYEDMALAYTEA